jgi:hypothetical protein
LQIVENTIPSTMTKAQMGIQNSATKASRCHNMNVGGVSMVVLLLQIHITFIVGH